MFRLLRHKRLSVITVEIVYLVGKYALICLKDGNRKFFLLMLSRFWLGSNGKKFNIPSHIKPEGKYDLCEWGFVFIQQLYWTCYCYRVSKFRNSYGDIFKFSVPCLQYVPLAYIRGTGFGTCTNDESSNNCSSIMIFAQFLPLMLWKGWEKTDEFPSFTVSNGIGTPTDYGSVRRCNSPHMNIPLWFIRMQFLPQESEDSYGWYGVHTQSYDQYKGV